MQNTQNKRIPAHNHTHHIYNFAFASPTFAFFSTVSNLVAFMTLPLTLSFPLINNFCAFALPTTSLPNSSSGSVNVTSAFLPAGVAPVPTVPVSLRSRYHFPSSPDLFFRLKEKMAPPVLMASARAASEERAEAMASKAADEGNLSVGWRGLVHGILWDTCGAFRTVCERHDCCVYCMCCYRRKHQATVACLMETLIGGYEVWIWMCGKSQKEHGGPKSEYITECLGKV